MRGIGTIKSEDEEESSLGAKTLLLLHADHALKSEPKV
jgi:hypothetical protein